MPTTPDTEVSAHAEQGEQQRSLGSSPTVHEVSAGELSTLGVSSNAQDRLTGLWFRVTARSITDRDPGKILVVEEDGEATGALLIIPEHSFTRTQGDLMRALKEASRGMQSSCAIEREKDPSYLEYRKTLGRSHHHEIVWGGFEPNYPPMGFPTSDDKQSTETNFARQRGRLASALTHLHTQNPAIGVWMHLDPNQLHFKSVFEAHGYTVRHSCADDETSDAIAHRIPSEKSIGRNASNSVEPSNCSVDAA